MRNVQSRDGLVHAVYTASFGDVAIVTFCTTQQWTSRTIDNLEDRYVVHVDTHVTCIACAERCP